MKNAQLRFGGLTYLKSTEKTTTSIKLRLDPFIGEVLPDPPREVKAHLISVIGGDPQVAAVSAAVSLGDRFIVEGQMYSRFESVSSETRSVSRLGAAFRAQEEPASPNRVGGRNFFEQHVYKCRQNSAAGSDGRFVWASITHIYGIPGMPEWALWFAGELSTHRAAIHALGIGSNPVIVKGEKEQFLDWLSWGVESGAIRFPAETGSIRWPSVNLRDISPQAE